jgi:hypothetical protein
MNILGPSRALKLRKIRIYTIGGNNNLKSLFTHKVHLSKLFKFLFSEMYPINIKLLLSINISIIGHYESTYNDSL